MRRAPGAGILAGAALCAAACACVWISGCAPPPTNVAPVPAKPQAPKPAPSGKTVSVTIYLPSDKGDGSQMEARKVSLPADASGPKARVQAVLDASVGGERLFPKGSKALSVDYDDKGLATVDLSSEIKSFAGGSSKEAAAANALALTAASGDKGAKEVLFKCEGQELESLGGHLDLTVPVEVDRSLIDGK